MHIRFISIKVRRFRSFLEQAELCFDQAGCGLYFLKGENKSNSALGSNGNGKSTIGTEALLWCLFGKTTKGLKNPDIIPWSGKGQTEVEVIVQVDDVEHRIKRTANKNLLTLDGKETSQDDINKLIGIPFEIVPYTIILGQRQPLFYDLLPSKKLSLFSETLNLERWDRRSEHAASIVQLLDKDITTLEAEIGSLRREQERLIIDFDSLKAKSKAWQEEKDRQLTSAELNKAKLVKQIASVANERDTADLKLDRALTELKAFKTIMERLYKEEKGLSSQVYGSERRRDQLISVVGDYTEQIASLKKAKCPTCDQPVHDAKQRIRALEEKIKENEETLLALDKDFKEASKKLGEVEAARNKQEEAKSQFENDAEDAREVLDRLLPKIADWQAQLKAIDRHLSEGFADANPYTEQMQTLRRRKDQCVASIEQNRKIVKDKSEQAERTRFWIRGFKDCKLLEIEEVLQEMEFTTNAMLDEFGLRGWKITYDIEKETKAGTVSRGLNVTVLSPDNAGQVKWEVFSGGESQRCNLIGSLALGSVLLNRAGVTTNLLILDEPTESLSREGIEDLVDLLYNYAKDNKRAVWLIDQHALESNRFVQTVLVSKDKKGSHLCVY